MTRQRSSAARGRRATPPLKLRHWVILLSTAVFAIAVVAILFGPAGPKTLQLRVGDCFDVPNSRDATGVQPLACTRPHTGELFAIVIDPLSSPHPDDPEFGDVVFDVCGPEFSRYTGRQAGIVSRLTYSAFWPNMQRWTSGDRAIQCYLTQVDGSPMTQSYKAT